VYVIIQHFHDHKKGARRGVRGGGMDILCKTYLKKLAVFKTDIVYDGILNAIYKFIYCSL
jgi:hypothetical protein